jgi:hypothetical protein
LRAKTGIYRAKELPADWELQTPGRVLVRSQLSSVLLAVPVIKLAKGCGPARLEWSDAQVTERLVNVTSCLMDVQRLGHPDVTDRAVLEVAKKYGPLRITKSGKPGMGEARGGLRAQDRWWEDSEAQLRWQHDILGLAPNALDADEDPFGVDWGLSDLAAWEPIAAWRHYGRVLRSLLSIAAAVRSGKGVSLTQFAESWSPASADLRPLAPPPMIDKNGDVVREDGMRVPRPMPPRMRFDPLDPASWEPSPYAQAWWRVAEGTLDDDGRPALNLRKVLSWQLDGLAESTGLRVRLVWPDTLTGDEAPSPVYAFAPASGAEYPHDHSWQQSQQHWGLWGVVVAQLHAAVTSQRDRVECDECGIPFPIEEGRRRPHTGEPAYCGTKCQLAGDYRRRRNQRHL